MIESLGSFDGKYEILERIAEGGMGSVYRVRHRLLNEVRVVKMMRSNLMNEESSRQRFFREARIAAKARHGNIAQVFDFSVDNDVAILVMEYIDGITLQDLLAEHGPPSLPLALEIARQSLRAIAFVHREGIIHRDISPDNLMLTSDSEGNPRIKLIDLGLAKLSEADSGLTKEGFFLGKLRYASPEQFASQRDTRVGAQSDVYSFGLVLYELLTGRYPIRGADWAQLMAGHVSRPPMPFSESDPDDRIPEGVRQAVLRSLAKDPEDRFADGGEFLDEISMLQKEHPWGPQEREEAVRVLRRPERRSDVSKPASDQDRLNGAFRVDESSAGRGTASDAVARASAAEPTLSVESVEPAVPTRTEAREPPRPQPREPRGSVPETVSGGTEVRANLADLQREVGSPDAETPVETDTPDDDRHDLPVREPTPEEPRTDIEPVRDEQPPSEEFEREQPHPAEPLPAIPLPSEPPREDDFNARPTIDQPSFPAVATDPSVAVEPSSAVVPAAGALRDEAESPGSLSDQELTDGLPHGEQAIPTSTPEELAPAEPSVAQRVAQESIPDASIPQETASEESPPPQPPPPAPAAPVSPTRPERPPISIETGRKADRPTDTRSVLAREVRATTPRPEPPPPVRPKAAAPLRIWRVAALGVLGLAVVTALHFSGVITLPGLGGGTDGGAARGAAGTLVLEALPWAQVVEITNQSGESVELPGTDHTPFVIPLAPGTYEVRMRNAEYGEKTLTAQISAGETTSETTTFAEIDEDELLSSFRLTP